MELKDLLSRLGQFENADDVKQAVTDMAAQVAQIKDLEAQVRKANSTVEGHKGRIQQLDGEKETLQQTLDALRGEMEEAQTRLDLIPDLEAKAALAARYETLAQKPNVFTNKALLKLVTSSNLADEELLKLVEEMEPVFAPKAPAPSEETLLQKVVDGKVQVPSGQHADAGFSSARTPEVVMNDIMQAVASGNTQVLAALMTERDNITQTQGATTRL